MTIKNPEAPPEPPKLTDAEQRASVAKNNAFSELDGILAKMLAPSVATTMIPVLVKAPDALQPAVGSLMAHVAPGQISELLAAHVQKVKQLEIALNNMVNLLIKIGGPGTLEEFMNGCTLDAETNAKMLNRALLSQGQVRPEGAASIIRAS